MRELERKFSETIFCLGLGINRKSAYVRKMFTVTACAAHMERLNEQQINSNETDFCINNF